MKGRKVSRNEGRKEEKREKNEENANNLINEISLKWNEEEGIKKELRGGYVEYKRKKRK